MKRKQRKFGDRVQLVVDEMLHLLGHSSRTSADIARVRSLQLTKLEERVLMSASPMAMVAEIAAVIPESSSGASIFDLSASSTSFDQNAAESQVSSDVDTVATLHEDSANDSAAGDDATEATRVVSGIELIVIDSRVQDADTLLTALLASDRDFRILRLDSEIDGVAQITEKLEQINNVSAIHLLTHGRDGEILLGSTRLNASTMAQHAPELLAWQHSLTDNADLLLYGCDVAGSIEGQDFVDVLSRLTEADVAASTDATGSQRFGGDWELEYQLGAIETQVFSSSLISSDWNDLLGVITVSTTHDVLDGDTSSVATLLASKGIDGSISLREAVIATNNTVGADTIFLTAGTYTFTLAGSSEDLSFTGDLDIRDGLTISGAGSGLSIIDANSLDRVFHVDTASPVTIEDVTIRGGVMAANNWGGGVLIDAGSSLNLNRVVVSGNSTGTGAGIYNYATLNATDTIISNNVASNWGGGLYNDGGAVNLDRVTISGNSADKDGGGIYNAGSDADMSLTNVTISGNTATDNGGGIWTSRAVTVTNSTIAFNAASSGDGIFGQGGGGIATLKNTILHNPAGVNANMAMTSLGHNIDSDGTAGLSGPGDQSSINPLLDAMLQNNGGFVTTHRLLSGSSAIDTGSTASAPTVDARNTARDAALDIGAYEVQGSLASRAELLVNTATPDIQATSSESRGSTHAVAAARDGSHVVVWTSTNQDTSGTGVYGQRFDAAGNKVGVEFLINQTTTNDQKHATVAMNGRGEFVVSWTSVSQDGSGNGVYARQYSAVGAALGSEFRVNATTAGHQDSPVVAMAADGRFLIVWEGQGAGDIDGIFGRWYAANGTPAGSEILINTTTLGAQGGPSVAMAPDGRAVIVWNDLLGVWAQLFDDIGGPDGPDEIHVETNITAGSADVEMAADGSFVVAYRQTLFDAGVYFRRFNADGTLLSPFAQIANTTSLGSQTNPSIAMVDSGNFLIVWEGNGSGDTDGVFGRQYTASGTALSSFEFRINGTTAGTQSMASAALLGDGSMVVAWSGAGGADSSGVYTRQFANAAPTITAIPNQTIAENGTTGAIGFTIGDAETAAFVLSVSATSSNAALVSPGGLVLAGIGANRTITVIPNANQSGTATITVNVDDSSTITSSTFLLTVTEVNNAPVITSNGGGTSATISVAENETAVTTATAIDADLPAQALTYSISGGADAAKFAINSTTGVLTFLTAPNYETATDSGANNVYDVTVSVSDGTLTDTQTIAVTVTDVNEAPVITSNGSGLSATISIAENSGAVTTLTATDTDLPAQSLTYSISGGADASKFSINDTTGVLKFVSARNFESPADVGANNVYDVIVMVSDGTLNDTQTIAVTVTAVNDNTPVITSNGGGVSASVSVAENATAVTTVTATDADLPSQTLTYSISGGADSSKFAINSTTGVLTFVSGRDYEVSTDSGANNLYDVIVQVSDGTRTDTQAIAVTVTAVNDNTPVITSNGGGASAAISVAENTTAVTTVVATDVDLPAQTLTYSISGGADAARFAINSTTGVLTFGSGRNFESPADVGANNVYDVIVEVSDGILTDSQAIAVTVTPVNDNTPVITSNGGGASAAVSVAENTTAVTTFTATDADLPGEALTYSISGGVDAGKFTINAFTGVLSFLGSPDFEVPIDSDLNNIYVVQVTANDGDGRTVNQTIRVTVADVNESPSLTAIQSVLSLAENASTVNATAIASLTIQDDGIGTNSLSLTGADAAQFEIVGTSLRLKAGTLLDFESKTSYTVQVVLNDVTLAGGPFATQAITLNITNVDEPPTADAGGPYTIAEGNSLTVTAGPATDPEGLPLTWLWDIDNDGAFDDATGSTATLNWAQLSTLSIPVNDSSVRVVRVRVTDAGGNSAVDSAALTISDTAPTINVTGAATAVSGTPYVINIATTDPGDDTNSSFLIVWGDGTLQNVSGTTTTVQHTYATPGGTRSIFVTATDENGTHPMTGGPLLVNVANTAPSAISLDNVRVPRFRPRAVVGNLTFVDPDIGDSHTIAVSDVRFEVVSGKLRLKAGNSLDPNIEVSIPVTITVTDLSGAANNATFNVEVNRAPVATMIPPVNAAEDFGTLLISTGSSFTDPDGDTLTYTMAIVSQDAGLLTSLAVNTTTGQLTATSALNRHGSAVIDVTATDSIGASAVARLTVVIQPVNDTPVAQDYSNSTFIDTTLVVSVPGIRSSISDIDGDSVTVTLVSGPAYGTVVLQPNGSFVYIPNVGFEGTDTFRFVAADGVLSSNVATATISVVQQFIRPGNSGGGNGINSSGFGSSSLVTSTTTNSSVSTSATSNPATTSNQANNENSTLVSITSGAGSASQGSTIAVADSPAPGVPSSPDDSGDNEDENILGVLLATVPDGNIRIGDVAVEATSTDVGHFADNDFVRRTYTITQRFDYDRIFSTSNSNEEIMRLNAQRASLYRQLSERVVEQSESVTEQLKNQADFKGRVVGSVGVVTTGFSVGYLFWAIRGGMLVSGLLAQIPAWTMLDPLLVMDGDQKEEDKESLQNLMDRQQAKMNKNEDTVDQPVTPDGKLEA